MLMLLTRSPLSSGLIGCDSEVERPARFGQFVSQRLANPQERCPELGGEQLRLLPSREVSALIEPVVVDKVGIRPLRPTLRRLVDLFGESAYGDRELNAPHIEEAAGRKIVGGVPVEA